MSEDALKILPDMQLDLKKYRMVAGDTIAFIEKMNGTQADLENWSRELHKYALAIDKLLEEAAAVPAAARQNLEELLARVNATKTEMLRIVASVNFPVMQAGDVGKVLVVNSEVNGFALLDTTTLSVRISDTAEIRRLAYQDARNDLHHHITAMKQQKEINELKKGLTHVNS